MENIRYLQCSWRGCSYLNNADENYCMLVEKSNIISQDKCSRRDASDLIGMICRLRHRNSNFPYVIMGRASKRSTEPSCTVYI